MPIRVLLSIKPTFADAILEGKKIFELRRTLFRNPTVRKIVIYASSPVRRVVGEFTVGGVLALKPDKLWEAVGEGSGVERTFFDEYFRGCEVGFALKVRRPRRYVQPLTLKEHSGLSRPPQSFRYLA